MKTLALILSLLCLPLFAAGDAPELIPVEKPARTAAQDIADQLAGDINSEISRRVELHRTLFRNFWKNPDATPEEIAAAMGTKARTFFAVAAENVAHIERLAKLSAVFGFSGTGGSGSFTTGSYGAGHRANSFTHASGRFASNGDAQSGFLEQRVLTTDDTQTALTATNVDGNTAYMTVSANSSLMADVHIIARQSGGTETAAYHRRCLIKRDGANNTSIEGAVQTVGTDIESSGAAAWDVTLAANDTNEALSVLVTGAAATNIRWVAKIDWVEVGY